MFNPKKDTQSRKFQITINTPWEKGYTVDSLQSQLQSLKGLVYYCLSEEIGEETKRHHVHIFVIYENPKRFSTMKKLFPEAHFEAVRASNAENRMYVFKEGKWENTEKGTTKIPNTQIEFGTLPPERNCSNSDLSLLYELIRDGKTDFEILEMYPNFLTNISDIQRCRLIIRNEEFKNEWRNLHVVYICGATGTCKTRSVMEGFGNYQAVYRVTDYKHPFDMYAGQDIILFEEFRSSLPIGDMLIYLDGYPQALPSRYAPKTACYTKVFFTTNVPLENQYEAIQRYEPDSWSAFLRRINEIQVFHSKEDIQIYKSVPEYLNRERPFIPVSPKMTKEIPFTPKSARQA